ncbi:MAG: hypothetical protein Ct9H300mP30_2200 [Methanobacteriota archaeon]|nr:MAG: hypothetical protein Ct9H300mP30_2200 [Euryarchaeota archaeon]
MLLAMVIGPVIASRIHGGRLIEGRGESAGLLARRPVEQVRLAGCLGTRGLTARRGLQRRLYFDDPYEMP